MKNFVTLENVKTLFLFFSLSILVLSGCSGLSGLQRTSHKTVQTRNVPMKIRSGESVPKKRLLVLPFIDVKESRSEDVVRAARNAVVQDLVRSGQFIVIQNSDFPKDLNSYLNSQKYDLKSISKVAQSLGIAAVMEGRILEIKAKRLSDQVGLFRSVKALVEAEVSIRVYATKTLKEILNTERSAKVTSETTQVGKYQVSDRSLEQDPKLIHAVTEKAFKGTVGYIQLAIDKIEWEGRIALVKADRIYLNAGRLSGLQVGDILKVMEKGEEVYDPETGILIGRVPGRMKGTIEIVSYFGKDGAIGIVHSGAGFEENDLVEIY